jgi:hypothetical protein
LGVSDDHAFNANGDYTVDGLTIPFTAT